VTPPTPGEEPESLRDLATRVIEDGTDYLKAELTLAKEETIARVKEARSTIVLLAVMLMLGQGAIMVLAIAFGLLLAKWLGLPAGFLVAGLVMIGAMALIARGVVERIRKIIR
jgi:hypothetical protein